MAHILVVDDDASHRSLLCDALQEMGYHTAEASNGREALDLRMPVMSGWGLLDVLRQSPRAKDLPIIIISAYGFEWEAELVGASGYISKPVDLEKVQDTVKRLIGPPPPKDVIH